MAGILISMTILALLAAQLGYHLYAVMLAGAVTCSATVVRRIHGHPQRRPSRLTPILPTLPHVAITVPSIAIVSLIRWFTGIPATTLASPAPPEVYPWPSLIAAGGYILGAYVAAGRLRLMRARLPPAPPRSRSRSRGPSRPTRTDGGDGSDDEGDDEDIPLVGRSARSADANAASATVAIGQTSEAVLQRAADAAGGASNSDKVGIADVYGPQDSTGDLARGGVKQTGTAPAALPSSFRATGAGSPRRTSFAASTAARQLTLPSRHAQSDTTAEPTESTSPREPLDRILGDAPLPSPPPAYSPRFDGDMC